jgi:GH24 family phage-related lysozyme (muramidase)
MVVSIRKTAIGVSAAAALAMSALIIPREGLVLVAAPDPIGILTYCYGETTGVVPGRTYTRDQCASLLATRVNAFEKSISGCLSNYATLPTPTKAAVISISYNVGTGTMCKSTMFSKLRAGDIIGACNEFPRFTRAGGRVLTGLVKRRAAEQAVCLKGVH